MKNAYLLIKKCIYRLFDFPGVVNKMRIYELKKFAIKAISSALVVSAMVAPVFVQAQNSNPSTLKVIAHSDLTAFDPIVVSSHIGSNYGYMIYDTLFSLDEKQVPQPQMVESYVVSKDKLTYKFVLRNNLKWHDGTPVVANDAVVSLQRWGKKDGLGQLLFKNTADLKVLDDRTFELKLASPFGFVLEALARVSNTGAFIMPARLANVPHTQVVAEAIGSGPYKLVKSEWVQGAKIVFEKNKDYVPRKEKASSLAGGKVAKFDRVEWLVVKDPSTALSALQRGEVDIWENAPADLVDVIKADKNLAATVINPIGRQLILRTNHLHAPFNNLAARQALYLVSNQEEYLRAAVGNPDYYRTCTAMFLCGTPLESDAGGDVLKKQDIEKAKELFRQSGWDVKKPIVILQATDFPEFNAAALVTAQNLRKLGLNPVLVSLDWASIQARRNNKAAPNEGGWNIFFTAGPPGNTGNPITSPVVLANCEKAFSGWPCDAELERRRAEFATISDPDTRKKLAAEFQKRAYEIGLYVPLGQFTQTIAHRANIKGLLSTSDVEVYWNVYRD
jgi:peptide/nickel transport system substrate-binding protein